ncbi:MAG: single-stranded-DNA-specific exonuclease RecJ [Xanthomonadaceae bacterium]|nr:single-stranded-DNA-specific exonuclease RecJ [Xanthomonadaceae bacterium]
MSAVRTIRRREAATAVGDWPATISPFLRDLYAARGATEFALAQPKLTGLLPPDGLSNIDAAVDLLEDAIAHDRHLVVVGDFDCDGATACAVGVRGLRMLGAQRVSYAVPNRAVHGYGLSPALVEDLRALQPDVLITVDHGIACHAGIDAAKAYGWRVLVTDHHLPGERLPQADAVVDPNLPGDRFASKALAGVGVMFYVLLALRQRLRTTRGFPAGDPELTALLDLVAVGTVADLVRLDANNRALVAAGLRRLRAGHGVCGLRALIEVARRRENALTAADIGYALAPRINAAGRLEDMTLGIECLLCDDPRRARELAEILDGINAERRGVQQQMLDDAEAALQAVGLNDASTAGVGDRASVVLHHDDWHPGVVGLVASKIKERLHRPTIAFAPSEPGGDLLRGSARSIAGFHIRDALATVDTRHPGLIEKFGGHAMAAGLSLRMSDLPAFRAAFETAAAESLTPESLQDVLLSDGAIPVEHCTLETALALRDGGPWGQGFPEPVFDDVFEVTNWKIVGEQHAKLELARPGAARGELRLDAIHFGAGRAPPPRIARIVYRLQPDDWRGGDAVQLVVVHCEPAS